jgi:hypothetical protein
MKTKAGSGGCAAIGRHLLFLFGGFFTLTEGFELLAAVWPSLFSK